jgi:hypothetical protein
MSVSKDVTLMAAEALRGVPDINARTPHIANYRLDRHDATTSVCRFYAWLEPTPVALDFVDELERRPDGDGLELMRRHRSLAKRHGYAYILLPSAWVLRANDDPEDADGFVLHPRTRLEDAP